MTQVTATIKDPNGNLYTGARVEAIFVPVPGGTALSLASGSVFPNFTVNTTDSFGFVSLSVTGNDLITPAGSQWRFSVISGTTPVVGFSTNITITGSTQDISAALQAAAAFLPSTNFGNISVGSLAASGAITTPVSVTTPNLDGLLIIDGVKYARTDVGVNQAISDCPSQGGSVYIPPSNSAVTCTTGIIIPANKPIRLFGGGRNSAISGSGIALITVKAFGASVEHLQIIDSTGNASTIGIDINNGATGINDVLIDHVLIQGTSQLGTGVRFIAALKSTIHASEINGFNIDVDLQTNTIQSNANAITDCAIRGFVTGVRAIQQVNDLFIKGTTIESTGGTGLSASGTAGYNKITAVASHFEVVGGTNVTLASGANFYSAGCGYFNANANADIVVTSGAGTVSSYADTLNSGVNHGGTGPMSIVAPTLGIPSTTGTGPIFEYFNSVGSPGVTGVNATGQNYQVSGFNIEDHRQPIYDNGGVNNTRIGATTGKAISFVDHTGVGIANWAEATGVQSVDAKITTADLGHGIILGTPQHLTGQTGNVGATNIVAAATAGTYKVYFDARTTTSGTGTTGTVSIAWTDEGGAKTFTSATWALNSVTVTGQVNGELVVHAAAASNIQVSTTATVGTSVYALDAWAERTQ